MDALKFHGSRYELLQVIKKLDGVMDDDRHFHCVKRTIGGFKRTGIDYRFDCAINEVKSGFIIVYRVRPTITTLFTPFLFLLLSAVCISAAAFWGESWLNAVIFAAASAISIIILSVLQKTCTNRFLRSFQKQTTNKKRKR